MHAHHNPGSCKLLLKHYEAALHALDEVVNLARPDTHPWTEETKRAES
jgi:hypothetical protein